MNSDSKVTRQYNMLDTMLGIRTWMIKGGSDDILSQSFGGRFSHKLDHIWPN